MRKRKVFYGFLIAAVLCMTSCGNDEAAEPGGQAESTIDVDLTQLSSTMVYSEVYNMMISPDDYPELGSDITVTGIFETYEEDGYTYCRLKNAKLG